MHDMILKGRDNSHDSVSARRAEALQMWDVMRPQIKKLSQKISRFSSIVDQEELEYGVAYEACYDGCLRFQNCVEMKKREESVHELGEEMVSMIEKGKMKKATFIFWYLQKKFFKEVDTGEVVFVVENSDGQKEVLSNYEFRKKFNKEKIKEAEAAGHIIKSEKIVKAFSELKEQDEDSEYFDPMDVNVEFDSLVRKRRG